MPVKRARRPSAATSRRAAKAGSKAGAGRAVAPLVWTPDLVARFWDALTDTKLLELGFGKLAGQYLLSAVRWHLRQGDRHIDFGAGDGDFVDALVGAGYPTAAFEASARRRARIKDRLAGRDGFLGCITARSRRRFDTVFLIEVIEHVLDEEMDATLDLIDRLLAPDGLLVVTTPNEENLDTNMAYCPVTGSLFHRWQHVRSFTVDSLSELLARRGFVPIVVHTLEFSDELFGESGGGLATNPAHADLFNTRQQIVLGDGSTILWIGGREETARKRYRVTPQAVNWTRHPVRIGVETSLVFPADLPAAERVSSEAAVEPALELTLAKEDFSHVEGHCWLVKHVAGLEAGDSLKDKRRSAAVLFEDGIELGPGHSIHQHIAEIGRGKFSHWDRSLYFSTSDNSSPLDNGRTYRVVWRAARTPKPREATRKSKKRSAKAQP